ncbi:MAG: hypothetical protein PCFJNLEI_02052 [Verrucomicrobiae bacterium]|nr:hypothetical protein [Verrucomicrobiae bacterium]
MPHDENLRASGRHNLPHCPSTPRLHIVPGFRPNRMMDCLIMQINPPKAGVKLRQREPLRLTRKPDRIQPLASARLDFDVEVEGFGNMKGGFHGAEERRRINLANVFPAQSLRGSLGLQHSVRRQMRIVTAPGTIHSINAIPVPAKPDHLCPAVLRLRYQHAPHDHESRRQIKAAGQVLPAGQTFP